MIHPGQIVVYKWTRQGTKHYYIGVHKCVPNGKCTSRKCNYIGSGVAFRKSYDVEPDAWRRSIIKVCDTYEEALALEAELIGEQHRYGAAPDPLCLNCTAGGRGATPSTISALWKDPNSGYNDPAFRCRIRAQRLAYWQTEAGQAQKKRQAASMGHLHSKESRSKQSASLRRYRQENKYTQAERATFRESARKVTLVRMRDPQGEAHEVNREEVVDLLRAGWRFKSRCVYVSNHTTKTSTYKFYKTAATMILSGEWEYGRTRGYEEKHLENKRK